MVWPHVWPLTEKPQKTTIEVWLSLVERYVRDVEAASSNLVTSTIKAKREAPPLFLLLKLGTQVWLGCCSATTQVRISRPKICKLACKAQGVDITEQSVVTLSPRPKRSTSFLGSASFCVCVYDANTRSRVTMLHFVQIYGIGQRTVLCPTAAAITINSD